MLLKSLFRSKPQESPGMTLEGVLAANNRLDDAESMHVEAPDALCAAADGRLLYSSANRIFSLDGWGKTPQLWAACERPVTALCSGGGLVAAGLAGGGLAVFDAAGLAVEGWAAPTGIHIQSVADCVFVPGEQLVILDCGYASKEDALARATWEKNGQGQLVAVTRSGASRSLACGLNCPMGLCLHADGSLIVTEMEEARIVDASGGVRQTGYPGYLGRIRKGAAGYVMACLARRDPLIEFLKTERAFVEEMKATIEPRHWISPRRTPEFSHDFPIELGATRLFGEIKPWAPSFSYGLAIELDEDLAPVGSAHSRANGRRHAASDIVLWNGTLVAVSTASHEILNLGCGSLA